MFYLEPFCSFQQPEGRGYNMNIAAKKVLHPLMGEINIVLQPTVKIDN